MSLVTKAKAAKGNLKGAFTNESGAIDLASIMVGIIVIGLIGGVIAATVFAIIPWAQDNAAKQQLESVVQAQNAYTGLNGGASYGELDELDTEGLLDAEAVEANVRVDVTGNGAVGAETDPSHYVAIIESDSDAFFKVTDERPQAHNATKAEYDALATTP